MSLENTYKINSGSYDFYNIIDEPIDESFKKTLSEQERFRYEVLVFMKKNGFKLINSKFFKKKDICIPVNAIEASYRDLNKLDINEIIKHKKIIKSF